MIGAHVRLDGSYTNIHSRIETYAKPILTGLHADTYPSDEELDAFVSGVEWAIRAIQDERLEGIILPQ